jgi:hypothetical protein
MSNTPNPNKKIVKRSRTIEFVKLYRDADGYVHTPRGFLPGAAYALVRANKPELRLPALADLPVK